MAITCVIIDDEPRAHTILRTYIAEVDGLVLLDAFRNALDAYKFLAANTVDLIFLDINMPKIDGFSLLDMLNPRPMVIMTTGHTEYAVKSYEYEVVDYLHKPIPFERFVTAVEKARKWHHLDKPKADSTHIAVKVGGRRQSISVDEIAYIECLGNYASIIRPDKPAIKTLITVKELEELLPEHLFLRIHRSFIVNTTHVTTAAENNLTIGDTNLPIGKTYKKYVEERLKG